MMKRYQTI